MSLDRDFEFPEFDEAGKLARKARLRLWLTMLRATRHIEYALRDRLKTEFDTTLPRFDVMAVLFRSDEGMTMTQLSDHLVVSNGNVTGIVDRLEQEGFVERITDENDRRTTLVTMTEEGRIDFSYMAIAHQEWINELLDAVDPTVADLLTDKFTPLRDVQKAAEQDQRKRKSKKKKD